MRPAKLPSAYFSSGPEGRDFERYGSVMASTMSRSGSEDTWTTVVWRQMSLPMSLEDARDAEHSDLDMEKDRPVIREDDLGAGGYNVDAEKLV